MNIFEFNSVPQIILNFKNEQRFKGNNTTLEKIASEIRIQKSYLSKVMKSEANLNKDQAYELSLLMSLDEVQRDYLFLLIDYHKAGNAKLKKVLKTKIDQIQNKNTQTKNYLSKNAFEETSSEFQKYYLKTEMQLVHLSLALKKYQKDPELLQNELALSKNDFQNILSTLEKLQLIEFHKDQIKLTQSNLHLNSESPLFPQWSALFKMKSIEWMKKIEKEDQYSFNVSFTATDKDREKIRLEFMKFLKKVEGIVKDSPSKGLYQLNFDLFKWLG